MFLNLLCIFKEVETKKKNSRQLQKNQTFSYRRLFLILVQSPLTKSERELDYYNQKVDIQVAQRIKT